MKYGDASKESKALKAVFMFRNGPDTSHIGTVCFEPRSIVLSSNNDDT